jgi:hypothetical protein
MAIHLHFLLTTSTMSGSCTRVSKKRTGVARGTHLMCFTADGVASFTRRIRNAIAEASAMSNATHCIIN